MKFAPDSLLEGGGFEIPVPPPADFWLYKMDLHELGIEPADVLLPLKPA